MNERFANISLKVQIAVADELRDEKKLAVG